MADVTISDLPVAPSIDSAGVFPYSNGTSTFKASLNQIIPTGVIVMWSGSVASIPNGWALCNGANGTPNLVDKFVLGAGTSSPAVGTTGGSKDAIVVSHSHPFSISGNTSSDGAHTHSGGASGGCNCSGGGSGAARPGTTGSAGSHSHSFSGSGTTSDTGSSGTNANLPPYYTLAYIMKL